MRSDSYGANAQADALTKEDAGRHGRTMRTPEISTGRPTNPPRAIPNPHTERDVDDEFPDVTDPRDPDLPDGWQAPEEADTGF